MTIRVILADDHAIMREGLRTLLDKEKDIDVVAEAANGREVVRLAGKLCPHVVVMDVSMPGLNGMEATRQIIDKDPQVRIVALSMHSDRRFVSGMLKAGARGYLLKDCAFEELAAAIREVAEDRTYLSAPIADFVRDDYVRQLKKKDDSAFSVITAREREVLQLLAEGLITKEIAARMNLSPKTVETHRRQMMIKLDLHSVAELTKYAIREGLTSP
jgi:DNA-binding NarL/FixJ family response regulator